MSVNRVIFSDSAACIRCVNMVHYLLVLTASLLVFYQVFTQEIIYVQNLDQRCLHCLCYAATYCNLTLGCDAGYCGPYKISRVYWVDAGQVVLPYDEIERAGAYQDCAISYQCAHRIITNYIIKYGRDCNGDGVTNCDDFSMINFNGGVQCHTNLTRNDAGRAWLARYKICYPESSL